MKYTNKEKIIVDQINKLLPSVTIHSSRAGTKKAVNESHYFIPPENKYLVNSEYYYKDTLKFIHFTSLFGIEGIIESKNIRLYNLNNLNDPREYSFAGNAITFNNVNKKDAKDNLFLLSMCNTELLSEGIENEFNMWRLYGDNGKGVAIELSFEDNSLENWVDYFLSSVQYGAASRTKLLELSSLLKEYSSSKPKVSIDLGQIVCFYKAKLFWLEKEIRLLFDNRKIKTVGATKYKDKDGNETSPIIKIDITKSSFVEKEIKYLELPIYHTDFKAIFENYPIPVPKITRIILGYQYHESFKKVHDFIQNICLGN